MSKSINSTLAANMQQQFAIEILSPYTKIKGESNTYGSKYN